MTSDAILQWHDFFLTVGGGAAALTGLVVVAISLHLPIVTTDLVSRHRARMALVGLAAIFVRCSLALMGGQEGRAVAIDLIVVVLCVQAIAVSSYAPLSKLPIERQSSLLRTVGSAVCYAVELFGAVMLYFGAAWGLKVAAVAMITEFYFLVSGSWLLLLGSQSDDTPQA